MKITRYLPGILLLVALSPAAVWADDQPGNHGQEASGNHSQSEAKEFEKFYDDFISQLRTIKSGSESNSSDKGLKKPGKAEEFVNLEEAWKATKEIKEYRIKMDRWCSEGDANSNSSDFAKKVDQFFTLLRDKSVMPSESVAGTLKVNKEGEIITSREMVEMDVAAMKKFFLSVEKYMAEKAKRLKAGDDQIEKDKAFLEKLSSLQKELGIEISKEEKDAFVAEGDWKNLIEGVADSEQTVCLFRKSSSKPSGPPGGKTSTSTSTSTSTTPTTSTSTGTKTGTDTSTSTSTDGRRGVRLPGDGDTDPTEVVDAPTGTQTGTQTGTPTDTGTGQQVSPEVPIDLGAIEDRLRNIEDPRVAQLEDALRRLQEEAALARLEDDNDDDEEQLQLPNIEGDKQGGSKTEAAPPPVTPPSIPPISTPSDSGQQPQQQDLGQGDEPPPGPPFMPVGVGNPMGNTQPQPIVMSSSDDNDRRNPLPQTIDPALAMILKQNSADSEFYKFMRSIGPAVNPAYLNMQPAQGGMSPFAQRLAGRSYGGGGAPMGYASNVAGSGTATAGAQATAMANPRARSTALPAALKR